MVKTTAIGCEAVPCRGVCVSAPLSGCELLFQPIVVAALLEGCLASLGLSQTRVASATASEADSRRQRGLQGMRVLLVEDNAIHQEFACKLLTDARLKVTVADNGQQAIERLALEPFDRVLMDCQMPVLDGYETTRRIRGNPKWRGLPTIAMTADAMAGNREFAIDADINDVAAVVEQIHLYTGAMSTGTPMRADSDAISRIR